MAIEFSNGFNAIGFTRPTPTPTPTISVTPTVTPTITITSSVTPTPTPTIGTDCAETVFIYIPNL